MLQQEKAEDFVIATNRTITIRKFAEMAFAEIGISLAFTGKGEEEIGSIAALDESKLPNGQKFACQIGDQLIKVDKRYYRPTEVELLKGDSSKAQQKLGWKPKFTVEEMCRDMIASDVQDVLKELHIKAGGFDIKNYYE